MTSIQIADETFVAASGAAVARLLADRGRWRGWWPDLQLNVREDRGEKGIRWTVAGALTGSMEIWLQPCLDGVVLHYFLHAQPSRSGAQPGSAQATRRLAAATRARRVAGKVMSFEVKARLEAGRAPGVPPRVAAESG